ncbi:hypothetical protein [Kibdelosporangium aridum]|uniref:hypothetical protein n=1 Tax=Kibdelosporangium aridum TaxID=2030 RepID=UPI000A06F3A8|nr:hypothetical protein [Kibdelosporangium aridum]
MRRTRERFAAVQELRVQGQSLGAISRQLDLDHGTVRRFARATTVDELLAKAVNWTSTLDKRPREGFTRPYSCQ